MEPRRVTRFGTVWPSRERWQGMLTGAGITLVLVVLAAIVLILMPQNQNKVQESTANVGQAGFEVAMNRDELNGLVDEYLNQDSTLKKSLRFQMTDTGMMVYGTYQLLGQNIDFGMKMLPEVTKKGNVDLKAESVAVGQLPLPVKYVMGYLDKSIDLPKWITIDTNHQNLLIDLGKMPEVQGMHFKAEKIDPKAGKFVFRGGFEK
ncbi:hypothetical protein WOSG25_021230 [Weissella oryzae SG25]|uniref:DUF2140 family protein n=1 Tax=Weissella oryzae (strain DSM 25784 / JCM 18191 / LMG 30913 / SG25) TaxID=1329250 RepID=A0A069CZ50_WEIOS|nr:YpmS family protein [Weissella oryzae]GAK30326.1 hypothetical protein WOSG25_021230 [Weissella oryzae SG25]